MSEWLRCMRIKDINVISVIMNSDTRVPWQDTDTNTLAGTLP